MSPIFSQRHSLRHSVSNAAKLTAGVCLLATALLVREARGQNQTVPTSEGTATGTATNPAPTQMTPQIIIQTPPAPAPDPAALAAAAAANLPDNVRIANSIRDIIRNDTSLSSDARRVIVTTVGESVTLSGQVPTSMELDTLTAIARDNAGPLRVINSVRVR